MFPVKNKINPWLMNTIVCLKGEISLSGHVTPIQCVRFGHTENTVCAGSAAGALKVWDLEACRLLRTLTGHKNAIRCVEFHPYGDFLTSGSKDTSIKLWDLRMGKMLRQFSQHTGPVNAVEFHPHEFLLASASMDNSINFWDLEHFTLVSSTGFEASPSSLSFGVKTIEESERSETDPEDDVQPEIHNVKDYRAVFQPSRSHDVGRCRLLQPVQPSLHCRRMLRSSCYRLASCLYRQLPHPATNNLGTILLQRYVQDAAVQLSIISVRLVWHFRITVICLIFWGLSSDLQQVRRHSVCRDAGPSAYSSTGSLPTGASRLAPSSSSVHLGPDYAPGPNLNAIHHSSSESNVPRAASVQSQRLSSRHGRSVSQSSKLHVTDWGK
ncbi:unnamed protein product [Nesidiocoris tenuis]|uniref:Uncharacterized protein n=1 Tax=Nesidiocoris tenuis TaxID=355587 RepID=A0A6H5GW73_9HEMI|nr:unnamed protein product [Nesidiocoris tenuis]